MFQRKVDEIYKDLPNLFGIADNILVVQYDVDGKDHDDTLKSVLQRGRLVDLKLNKDKCYFRCTSVPCFGEAWHETWPAKTQSTNGGAFLKNKKGTPSIPWNN